MVSLYTYTYIGIAVGLDIGNTVNKNSLRSHRIT